MKFYYDVLFQKHTNYFYSKEYEFYINHDHTNYKEKYQEYLNLNKLFKIIVNKLSSEAIVDRNNFKNVRLYINEYHYLNDLIKEDLLITNDQNDNLNEYQLLKSDYEDNDKSTKKLYQLLMIKNTHIKFFEKLYFKNLKRFNNIPLRKNTHSINVYYENEKLPYYDIYDYSTNNDKLLTTIFKFIGNYKVDTSDYSMNIINNQYHKSFYVPIIVNVIETTIIDNKYQDNDQSNTIDDFTENVNDNVIHIIYIKINDFTMHEFLSKINEISYKKSSIKENISLYYCNYSYFFNDIETRKKLYFECKFYFSLDESN